MSAAASAHECSLAPALFPVPPTFKMHITNAKPENLVRFRREKQKNLKWALRRGNNMNYGMQMHVDGRIANKQS